MNVLTKAMLGGLALVASGMASADIYNHGNHNDPVIYFQTDTIHTYNCQSSINNCVAGINVEAKALQICKSSITHIDDGGIPAFGQPYNHSVAIAYSPVVLSAVSNGGSAYNYQIEMKMGCRALQHPGQKYQLSM